MFFFFFYCGAYLGYFTLGLISVILLLDFFRFIHVRWILFAPFVSFSLDLIILKLVIFAVLSHYVYVETYGGPTLPYLKINELIKKADMSLNT